MNVYTRALRPVLFSLEAERAHDLTMAALSHPVTARALSLRPGPPVSPSLAQQVLGRDVTHPVGLAAGLDKQGTAAAAFAMLGFSFVEIGTVTPAAQPGNPKPRLFRLPGDRAIINRFGFNSVGAASVADNLAVSRPADALLGVNVGKNKDTPNDRAAGDYIRSVEALHRFADYFVINVSSPNTAGLRDLQESRALRALVEQVSARVRAVSAPGSIPVLVKVSPDAAAEDLLHSVDAALEGGAEGVIATNTTLSRAGLSTTRFASETGGLSGAPLRASANTVCRLLHRHLGRRIPIVGVGGIFTADDAYERIRSGASLVQIYTALIYEGPRVVHDIVAGLAERLDRDGFSRVADAIGADV